MFGTLKQKLNPLNYIPEPKDIYESLYPLYVTSKIFCLAPFVHERLVTGKVRYVLSFKAILLYSLALITYLISAVYLVIIENAFELIGNLELKMQNVGGFLCALLAFVEIIFSFIFGKKLTQVIYGIDEVETILKSLKLPVSYKRIYLDVLVELGMCLLTAVYISVFYLVFVEAEVDVYKTITLSCLFFIPYFVNLIMEVQYITSMRILRFRFHDLNDYLSTILKKPKATNGNWVDDNIKIIDKPHGLLQPMSYLHKEAVSDPVLVVDNVASLHIKLTDIATWVNVAFNVQLLLRITIAFVSIVTALFVIGVNFVKTDSDHEKLNLNLMFTSWAFSGAIEVWLIVWVTCKVCEEATRCPRLMHKIRNNTKNGKLQDAIEHYSLQMYHNRLKFDVCGLFPLDYTLLYTIIAGVTTYLVILIQFSNSNYLTPKTTEGSTTPIPL